MPSCGARVHNFGRCQRSGTKPLPTNAKHRPKLWRTESARSEGRATERRLRRGRRGARGPPGPKLRLREETENLVPNVEFDVEDEGAALTFEGDLDRLAGAHAADGAGDVLSGRDRFSVDGGDHVAAEDAGSCRG